MLLWIQILLQHLLNYNPILSWGLCRVSRWLDTSSGNIPSLYHHTTMSQAELEQGPKPKDSRKAEQRGLLKWPFLFFVYLAVSFSWISWARESMFYRKCHIKSQWNSQPCLCLKSIFTSTLTFYFSALFSLFNTIFIQLKSPKLLLAVLEGCMSTLRAAS